MMMRPMLRSMRKRPLGLNRSRLTGLMVRGMREMITMLRIAVKSDLPLLKLQLKQGLKKLLMS